MLTAETLRKIVDYNSETGVMTHKVKLAQRTKIGSEIGWLDTSPRCGYRRATLMGKTYLVHRLAWLFVHGEWPEDQLDHIDRDRTNNRIGNLREVTNQENQFNTSPNYNKKNGIVGVYYHKANRKWTAAIAKTENGVKKQRYLGSFDTAEDAYSAYIAAKHQYHAMGGQIG